MNNLQAYNATQQLQMMYDQSTAAAMMGLTGMNGTCKCDY
jgi:hypothetical protein